MPSLEDSFEELRARIKSGVGIRNTGGDPVYYLVFPPSSMLTVKKKLKTWTSRLELDGRKVMIISLGKIINDFFENHPLRSFWLSGEKDATVDEINRTLSQALIKSEIVEKTILEVLKVSAGEEHGMVILTDVETIHPYLRIGAVEQKLQGHVEVPLVVLYPGERRGQSQLSFLGIYPDDGNYRSIHFGG